MELVERLQGTALGKAREYVLSKSCKLFVTVLLHNKKWGEDRMSLILTIVVSILNLVVAILEWVSIERKIKLRFLILSSKKKKSYKKKRTTCSRQANR